MSSSYLLVKSLVSLIAGLYHLLTRIIWLDLPNSFPVCISLVFLLVYFMVLAETSTTVWNSKCESEHHFLVPGIVKMFPAFPHSVCGWLWVCNVLSWLHQGMFFFISNILKVIIIKGCCVLSHVLCASVEIIICFLFFGLLMWYIKLIDLIYWGNPAYHLVWEYDVSDVLNSVG